MGENIRFPDFGFQPSGSGINRKRGYQWGYLQEKVEQRPMQINRM